MKRGITLLLILCIALSLAACSGTSPEAPASSPATSEATEPTPHVHSFGDWVTVKAATCTEAGEQERTCSCGEKETQAIPAAGHTIATIAAVKATCTTDGSTAGTYCTTCGKQIEKPTAIPASHSFDQGKTVKNPTCTETGLKRYTCSVCGATKDEAIAKINHTFDAGKITQQATCTKTGVRTFTCTMCGTTKTESIATLGHDPDSNNICRRCGITCPITLSMTDAEKSRAATVYWITNRTINHRDEKSQFELHFQLKDTNENVTSAPCMANVKITNENGETVYSATRIVKSSDFGTWTYFNGNQIYQATIYIKDSEITRGTSSKGTVSFTVYNEGYFDFSESTLSVSDLPVKAVSVSLPSLPKEIAKYGATTGNKLSSCTVTDITYEVNDDDLYIYFTLEKTYDREGSGLSDTCGIGWKLYDSDGYVVRSGTFLSSDVKVGEKVRDEWELVANCVKPGGSYRLEILDYVL